MKALISQVSKDSALDNALLCVFNRCMGEIPLYFSKNLFVNPASVYKFALIYLFPLFVASHGFMWVVQKVSYAPAVYAMKLAYMPFIALALYVYFKDMLRDRPTVLAAAVIAPVFIISLIMPLLLNEPISTGYYVTDTAGLGITVLSSFIFYAMLRDKSLDLAFIETISAQFCFVISIYMIVYFFASSGDKISVTPEIQIPMAIVIGAYLAPVNGRVRPPIWLIALIAIACALSQLRENVVIFAIAGAACIVRGFFFRADWRPAFLFVAVSISAVMVLPATRTALLDRYQSLQLFDNISVDIFNEPSGDIIKKPSGDVGSATKEQKIEVFVDSSLNQRFVEIGLMSQELSKSALTLVMGKGFGATYENRGGVLIYYGERVHNAHSTPFLVYFRNGIYGFILFALPAIFAFVTLFSKNTLLFRASLTLGMMYLALLFNQYFYWGVQFGLALAFWFYCFQKRNEV